MKFFTPDLYVRLQSNTGHEMDAADAEWDLAVDGYENRLCQIRPDLPESVRTLIDRYSFHDARILSLAKENSTFVVVLEPESPPSEVVILIYKLSGEPLIKKSALPEALCSPDAQWLYDEWSLLPDLKTYSHEILLRNGWDIQLLFEAVTIVSAHDLLQHPMAQPA